MTWVAIAFAVGAIARVAWLLTHFPPSVTEALERAPAREPRPPMMDLREAYRPQRMIASEARRYRGIQ